MDAKSDKKVLVLMGRLRRATVINIRELEDTLYDLGSNVIAKKLYELRLDNARKELKLIDNMIETKSWNTKEE